MYTLTDAPGKDASNVAPNLASLVNKLAHNVKPALGLSRYRFFSTGATARAVHNPHHQILVQGWLHGATPQRLFPFEFTDDRESPMAPPSLLMFGLSPPSPLH